jgi:hypothetical protein
MLIFVYKSLGFALGLEIDKKEHKEVNSGYFRNIVIRIQSHFKGN